MAKEPKQPKEPLDPSTMSRRRQIIETFKMTKQVDRAAPWWMLGAFLLFGGDRLRHLLGAARRRAPSAW